jgi:hypothetical protein
MVTRMTLEQRSVLSHRLRCQQRADLKPVQIFESDFPSLALDEPLPKPAEQIDRLVIWIGEHQPSASEPATATGLEVSAWMGAAIVRHNSSRGLSWILDQEEVKNLLDYDSDGRGNILFRLKISGWNRYESTKRSQVNSRTAFMAMQFDPGLLQIVDDFFKLAVARAGFELKLLTDNQPAGLIDDQLRVALRTARFVIADLTHANNGAYWEAGFAEGLGRPVIYTCRKVEWDEVDERGRHKVHFDTSHLVTIIWSPDDLRNAADRLTATIRATLPGEARMTDC